LHLHWCLAKPAEGEAVKQLKEARKLATVLVGGDASNVPACHPIRWPGSWHRKKEPRLCVIEALNEDVVIDLEKALEKLRNAVKANGDAENGGEQVREALNEHNKLNWGELINQILTGESFHRPLTRLAMKLLRAGMNDGAAINLLREWMRMSDAPGDARWEARYNYIPRAVASAREKIDQETKKGLPSRTWKRPTIIVNTGKLDEAAIAAEQALIGYGHAQPDLQIYQRGEFVMRPMTHKRLAADKRETTAWALDTVGEAYLLDVLCGAACFNKFSAKSEKLVVCDPPTSVIRILLARKGRWTLPVLKGVSTVPIMREDGSICNQEGYDAITGMIYKPDPDMVLPFMPLAPSLEDARAALETLKEPFREFPFVTGINGTDCSVALSGVLTPFVRHLMPAAPLHGLNAPAPGTGKSLLVDICSIITTGRYMPVIAPTDDEKELDKRISASLMDGDALASIDNIPKTMMLECSRLCQALTQSRMKIRILGLSEQPEVTVTTIAMNGSCGSPWFLLRGS
jgi:hypothetical protein